MAASMGAGDARSGGAGMSNARSRLPAYGRTPKALLRDPGIRPIAKAVYAMVDEVAGHEDVTIELLAEWLGVNPKTARKALHEARDAGWIEVVEVSTSSGQQPSEYIANAYSFQHLSEGREESSRPQRADQGRRVGGVPESSGPQERSGTPPSQKVPQGQASPEKPGESDEVAYQKVVGPGDSQKVVGPTYLRDDETPPPTSSTDDDAFRQFWARFPDNGYKGKKSECRRIWHSMSVEDRRDTWRALTAYLKSEVWRDKIPTPLQWLENEPAIAYRQGNIPKPKSTRRFYSVDDVKLND